ncbi:MAG: hypothetical protein JXP48_09515 [Acidobacteria bacterium]|nr:hypothetical protein [Acidobacteriota bacterium]
MHSIIKASLVAVCFPLLAFSATSWGGLEPFSKWSLEGAVKVLNDSPWARQETFTRVIRGVGSGISGEKEIYNTFYVRFLSARPVREAYARIQQIQHGYDRMTPEEKQRFESLQAANLDMDVSQWIVLSVGFRSNDPNEESAIRRFFQSETVETLRSKAFLSTPSCPQVELIAYFPHQEESVGAKFVFPREVDGVPVIGEHCPNITLELLDVPGTESRLYAKFEVKSMRVGDQLVF